MHFKNLVEDLSGTPAFRIVPFHDYNPVSGQSKVRMLGKPNGSMRTVHARFIGYLRRTLGRLPNATCYRRGDSAVKNVWRHHGNRHFYLLDVRNAYGTVDLERLSQLLFNRDMPFWDYRVENAQQFLKRYCGADEQVSLPGLVVGAPASPVLFNIYAGILLDESLASLCAKHDITYTRYIDDLTFSSRKKIGLRVRRQIRERIIMAGFTIHDRKARLVDLRKHGSVVVTGVGLNARSELFVPRTYVRLLRGFIHRALTDGTISNAMVEGRMGVFRAITRGRKLNQTESKLVALYQQWRQHAA